MGGDPSMNINLEYYKIFYYVAKYGSITQAANKLCLSQPAVSQSIKQLEELLGITLFFRKSKGVVLTIEGETLFSYVSKGYEQIIQGENKIKEILGLDSGQIRIGASDMTLQFYLLPYLEQFSNLYPGIKMIITNAPTPRTLEHLMAGDIDFGVISSPFNVDSRINVHYGRKIKDVFVAGERFSHLKGKVLDYRELMNYPIISLEGNTSSRRYIDSYLYGNGVILNPEFELATSSMVVNFAARNMGIGCVVEDFALEELNNKTLFKLEFETEIPNREICVVSDSKIPMSKASKTLMEMLRK